MHAERAREPAATSGVPRRPQSPRAPSEASMADIAAKKARPQYRNIDSIPQILSYRLPPAGIVSTCIASAARCSSCSASRSCSGCCSRA